MAIFLGCPAGRPLFFGEVLRTLCGWGGRATTFARATESVSKSEILPIIIYKKATLAGVAVILVVESRYNCLSEKRIASSTEQLGFCLSTDLSTLSDAVRVNPNIASAAKASS